MDGLHSFRILGLPFFMPNYELENRPELELPTTGDFMEKITRCRNCTLNDKVTFGGA